MGALGSPIYFISVSGPATSAGVPIRTEAGVGAGSSSAAVLAAYPSARRPCADGAGSDIDDIAWGDVRFYQDDGRITSVGGAHPDVGDACEYADF